MGGTGVGKKTFINALANHLVYDTLDTALQGSMQVLIPFKFSISDPDTFEPLEIGVGTPTENELSDIPSISKAQFCQTYTFTIGKRLLRLIDTPSIGDTRGPFQDVKNMQHIFTYICQYKYLNSVCILAKSDHSRSDTKISYYIKEFLTRLHIHTYRNITWVLTNARDSFYVPGRTLYRIRKMFEEMPIINPKLTRKNCLLFENQTFLALAVNKDHSEIIRPFLSSIRLSWNISTVAFSELISSILCYKPHMVCETFALNMVRQLTCKLIELINDENSSRSSAAAISGDNSARNLEKVFIRNVCVSLAHFINTYSILPFNNQIDTYYKMFLTDALRNQGQKCNYIQYLKEHSVTPFTKWTIEQINRSFCINLKDWTEQTKISDFLKENSISSFGSYLEEYILNSYNTKLNEQTSKSEFLQYIGESSDFASNDRATKYLCTMFHDELIKQTMSVEYSRFLEKNSMVPLSYNKIKLICQLIFEQIKWSPYHSSSDDIRNLDNLITKSDEFQKILTINIDERTALLDVTATDQVSQMKNILKLLEELCALPIHGIHIRQYMEVLEKSQKAIVGQKENIVNLPASAQSSSLMRKLRAIVEQN